MSFSPSPSALRPVIVAHRGASAFAAENTIAAFERAIALGADWIELDVRRTQDQVLVVYHDTDVAGYPLHRLTYPELQAIAPDIPTLDAALRCCQNRIRLDIELKESGYESDAVQQVLTVLAPDAFLITSFLPETVARIKHILPQLTVGLLVEAGPSEALDALDRDWLQHQLHLTQADLLAPHWSLLQTKAFQVPANDLPPLWVWTVDEADGIQQLLHDPRITGIITNQPDLGLHLRDRFLCSKAKRAD